MTTGQYFIGQVETASKNELDDVVRSIFDDPTASVEPGWTANPLGAQSNGIGTMTLLKVEGFAVVGGASREWSTVLKVMSSSGVGGVSSIGSVNLEVEANRRDIFHDQLSGFRAARAYSITDKSNDIVWLWTEDMSEFAGMPWSQDQYLQSAGALGRLKGRLFRQPIEDEVWMNHGATIERWTSSNMFELFNILATRSESDYVREALPGDSYDRALQFGAELSLLAASIGEVPRTVAHGDCHVRNLFTSPGTNGRFELMAIDLGSVGIEPIGCDIGTLLGSSLTWGDEEAEIVMSDETAFFDAFINGFDSEGAEVSRDLIRLSYLTAICGYGMAVASVLAVIDARFGPWKRLLERYGGEELRENLPSSYRPRLEFITSLFDEALVLADQVTGHT